MFLPALRGTTTDVKLPRFIYDCVVSWDSLFCRCFSQVGGVFTLGYEVKVRVRAVSVVNIEKLDDLQACRSFIIKIFICGIKSKQNGGGPHFKYDYFGGHSLKYLGTLGRIRFRHKTRPISPKHV